MRSRGSQHNGPWKLRRSGLWQPTIIPCPFRIKNGQAITPHTVPTACPTSQTRHTRKARPPRQSRIGSRGQNHLPRFTRKKSHPLHATDSQLHRSDDRLPPCPGTAGDGAGTASFPSLVLSRDGDQPQASRQDPTTAGLRQPVPEPVKRR